MIISYPLPKHECPAPQSIGGLHDPAYWNGGTCGDCGAVNVPEPRIYAPHTIEWSYDAVQRTTALRCTDCGKRAVRTGIAGGQAWVNGHVCGQLEPVIRRKADGSLA